MMPKKAAKVYYLWNNIQERQNITRKLRQLIYYKFQIIIKNFTSMCTNVSYANRTLYVLFCVFWDMKMKECKTRKSYYIGDTRSPYSKLR